MPIRKDNGRSDQSERIVPQNSRQRRELLKRGITIAGALSIGVGLNSTLIDAGSPGEEDQQCEARR